MIKIDWRELGWQEDETVQDFGTEILMCVYSKATLS